MSGHIVLLGDSIFDNRRYTSGEPDVVSHLRSILRNGWRATLLAVDGATTASMESQVADVPRDATHVVVSVGGNDALMNSDILQKPARSTTEALELFGSRVSRFEADYRNAVRAVAGLRRKTTLCTIYNGNLEPERASIARVGLMIFNDAILRVAFERAWDVIDLRLVCSEPADYANPIEPSGTGGRKIADAIARAAGASRPSGASQIFV